MAGAASALFLLDIKGRVLVWRDYRGDVSAAQAERFFTKLIEKEVVLIFLLSLIGLCLLLGYCRIFRET
jgi:hypothetical protein|uniref:Putative Clathrin Coat Assembly protein n=1 Tax=Arabidopsis thaliana TaxID=3702 RepID=Q0WPY1_ARATH|nr:putative Clathrin Coat Assembly protein [Arabidopsis thaliana]